MAWAFVRPVDGSVLDGRPLLDVGTGDAQTLVALTEPNGLRVGVDRAPEVLHAARHSGLREVVAANARELPFAARTFRTVLAADIFHHLSDDDLDAVVRELRRVTAAGGRVVAWWYESGGRGGAGDPAYPRTFADVAPILERSGFRTVSRLELRTTLDPSPPTVGVLAEA